MIVPCAIRPLHVRRPSPYTMLMSPHIIIALQRKINDAQEAEAALRHSLLLSPAMRRNDGVPGSSIIAGKETRLQELYGG